MYSTNLDKKTSLESKILASTIFIIMSDWGGKEKEAWQG